MDKKLLVLIAVVALAFCGAQAQRWNEKNPFSLKEKSDKTNLTEKKTKSLPLKKETRRLHLAGKQLKMAGDMSTAMLIVEVREPGSDLIGSLGSRVQILVADSDFVDENDPASMDASWNLFKNGGQPLADFYNGLFGKIPANAGPTLDYSQGIAWETQSIDVTPGTYDIVFTDLDSLYYYNENYLFNNPAPVLLRDNFEIEAGWVYYFAWYSLNYFDGELAIPPYEVKATSVTSTPSSAELTANEPIMITFTNSGMQSLSAFDLYYSINGGTEIHETLNLPLDAALAMGDSYTYTFSTLADFSAVGDYEIAARVSIVGDNNPDNNELTFTVKHTTPGTLPFFDPFDETLSNWAVIDFNGSDEDGFGTWTASVQYDQDWNENYYALYLYLDDRPGDDWLRTIRPYRVEQGDYHISFSQLCIDTDYPEKLQVWYGTSPNVNSMTLLESIMVTNTNAARKIVNFNNTVPDDYYFAIQAVSDAAMYAVMIDNVEIAAGTQTPQPDVLVTNLQFKAYQSCELVDSAIVVVFNSGDVESVISTFDVKYQLNNAEWQTKTIVFPNLEGSDGLKTGDGMVVVMDGLDFSAAGEHTLTVVAQTSNQGTVFSDTVVGKITKTEPTGTLPYYSDFGVATDIADWTMLTPRDWRPDSNHIAAWNFYAPLISKCIELPAGDYKLKTTFTTGMTIFAYPSDFTLKMGQPGVFPDEWTDTIVFEQALDTQDADTTVTYTFTVATGGTYQFAYTLLNGSMRVKDFEISKGTTNIGQISDNKTVLFIAPNPASTQAIIRAQNDEIQQIIVSDLTGKTLFVSPENLNTAFYELNVAQMPKGIYLVKIFTENTFVPQTKKLIVK